jgi:putative nucleotidyltransferase with HDIG domain
MFFVQGQHFIQALPEISQDLPVSPVLFQQVFLATGEGATTSMEALGAVLEQDQGLAVKVLSMANSAYYGLQSQVSSVKRAVLVLGLKEVRKLLLLMSVRSLEKKLNSETLNIAAHWKHQVEVAHVAQALAVQSGATDHDELFTAGLLHDLGKLITAIHQPGHWRSVQKLAREKNIPLYQAEELYWGLDHALIRAMILKSWYLPTSLTEPINWHHNPDLAQEYVNQARLLCLADFLTHMHFAASSVSAVYDAWEQDLQSLDLTPQASNLAAQEILSSDRPSSFLRGLGLFAPAAH